MWAWLYIYPALGSTACAWANCHALCKRGGWAAYSIARAGGARVAGPYTSAAARCAARTLAWGEKEEEKEEEEMKKKREADQKRPPKTGAGGHGTVAWRVDVAVPL